MVKKQVSSEIQHSLNQRFIMKTMSLTQKFYMLIDQDDQHETINFSNSFAWFTEEESKSIASYLEQSGRVILRVPVPEEFIRFE